MADDRVKITGQIETDAGYDSVDLRVELSLRDLFAAFALAGLAARPDSITLSAKRAYEYADAALAAREGTGE